MTDVDRLTRTGLDLVNALTRVARERDEAMARAESAEKALSEAVGRSYGDDAYIISLEEKLAEVKRIVSGPAGAIGMLRELERVLSSPPAADVNPADNEG